MISTGVCLQIVLVLWAVGMAVLSRVWGARQAYLATFWLPPAALGLKGDKAPGTKYDRL